MSNLKSRPPSKPKQDLDAFLSGAESGKKNHSPADRVEETYPWQEPGVRSDVTKAFNLRLSEPYLLKLRYIGEHTPDSMQQFCLRVLQEAIDNKINDLTK
ncbi:hypothetical protein [Candidatus Methylomicrobium oryzae]|uniref:hypothetical protein n=1 Tax=Candidatus Methylomicrobium oryzae TaxID=2802053 RepID=UPI001921AE1D|nr:hypothetical protein [Methylomicrobium sp. RS1]MBL1265813.1 hypothetical protein [Methylomicrobium sp. RS1]